ncbi:MFS transporter [Corynebacterium poyangense]|uniref:MFS transporter n=2 Tax=Corynebacterium poyangense TaxID=2684405 RepID=A0A7H0SSA0_9CORY|nr:MFS transporter [Corynebacterium poyangense]QNQ91425.1 MFS transporter [Corynebacterium poyangense]
MGLGLVDPILPTIARQLNASAGQTELLFTSYLFITAIVMFFSAWVSTRIGIRRTLILGVAVIVTFATLCTIAGSVNHIIGFRAGWGLGNALFVSTALSAIVSATSHATMAVMFYEAAVGLGFAFGPLLGGLLGEVSWRGPFAGTAILMGCALIAIVIFFQTQSTTSTPPLQFFDGLRGAFHPGMRWLALGALFFNFSFIMMLVYSPFPVEHAASIAGIHFTPIHLGFVFFGWGTGLAISSVWVAPKFAASFGTQSVLLTAILSVAVVHILMALFSTRVTPLIVVVIIGGFCVGIVNTLLTTVSMSDTGLSRPVASSAYSGVRFIGSALAPTLVGPLENFGMAAPLWIAAIAAASASGIIWLALRDTPEQYA